MSSDSQPLTFTPSPIVLDKVVGVSENPDGVTLTGFEGPEKKIELDFVLPPLVGGGDSSSPSSSMGGMRQFSNEQWQNVLDAARCTIISSMSTPAFNSYVLSESSLFVYSNKVILKTCGTTRLLLVIPMVLKLAESIGAKIEFFCFSRRNFLFPDEQPAPHTSFPDEVSYLNTLFKGEAYTLGPITHDHWLLYIADYTARTDAHIMDQDITVEVMMLELDSEAMANFYAEKHSEKECTKAMQFDKLFKECVIAEHLFDPCGYSCNGHAGDAYFTIHVTPEAHCSYVSFETNANLASYKDMLTLLLKVLKPGKFCLTVFSDNACLLEGDGIVDFAGFHRVHKTSAEFNGHYDVTMANYVSS